MIIFILVKLREKDKKLTLELLETAIELTESDSKIVSIKEVKKYINNNWTGIENLFEKEKYICSAEGHISHILSSRLISRPMGWSMIGADEMARMRTFRENGGNISTYYSLIRLDKKKQSGIKKSTKKLYRNIKKYVLDHLIQIIWFRCPILLNQSLNGLKLFQDIQDKSISLIRLTLLF